MGERNPRHPWDELPIDGEGETAELEGATEESAMTPGEVTLPSTSN